MELICHLVAILDDILDKNVSNIELAYVCIRRMGINYIKYHVNIC